MQEFVCESKLGRLLKAKIDISVGQKTIKWRFDGENNRVLASIWQDDESWTNI